MRSPCLRCGVQIHIGEGPTVVMQFKPAELRSLALSALDLHVRDRLLCALGTIDEEMEREIRRELA